MQDVNTLYSKQVFPFQMQMSTLYDILIEKGIFTQEEYSKIYQDKIKDLQDRAKAIKEDEDGVRLATDEEDKEETNKKVLTALKNKKELEDRLEGEKK